jgi:hypothetical protein
MEAKRYMSLVFRGIVEEYDNAGVRPSVFMEGDGSLHIYLCDCIIPDEEENYGSEVDYSYQVNGGQFVETVCTPKSIEPIRTKTVMEEDWSE